MTSGDPVDTPQLKYADLADPQLETDWHSEPSLENVDRSVQIKQRAKQRGSKTNLPNEYTTSAR